MCGTGREGGIAVGGLRLRFKNGLRVMGRRETKRLFKTSLCWSGRESKGIKGFPGGVPLVIC